MNDSCITPTTSVITTDICGHPAVHRLNPYTQSCLRPGPRDESRDAAFFPLARLLSLWILSVGLILSRIHLFLLQQLQNYSGLSSSTYHPHYQGGPGFSGTHIRSPPRPSQTPSPQKLQFEPPTTPADRPQERAHLHASLAYPLAPPFFSLSQ